MTDAPPPVVDDLAAQFDTLLAGAPLGIGVFDRECRHVRVNPVLAEMNGRPADELVGRTPGEVNGEVGREAEVLYHRVMAEGTAMRGVRLTGEVSARPGDIRHWDLSFHPVLGRTTSVGGHVGDGRGGDVVGLCVVVDDVTAEVALQEQVDASSRRLAEITESMAVGYLVMDDGWRIRHVNAEAVAALGRPRDELLGGVIWELFPQTAGTAFEAGYRRAKDEGRPVTFDAYYPPPLDRWYEVRATPEGDGVALYFLDVTARVVARREAEAAAGRARLLADVSVEVAAHADADGALAALPGLLVPAVADWCLVTAVDGLAEHPSARPAGRPGSTRGLRALRRVAAAAVGAGRDDALARYADHRHAALRAVGDHGDGSPLWRAVVRGLTTVLADDATAALLRTLPPGPAAQTLAELAPSAALTVPLVVRGRVVGVLELGWDAASADGGERAATPVDELGLDPVATRTALAPQGPGPSTVALVRTVADRAATALDAVAAAQRQREIAEELQRSLLTAPPEPDHAHVVVRYVPAAAAAQVGGDWYDAFVQPPGATVLVVGDVVGHDTGAAAAMGQVRTLVRAAAVMGRDGPAQVLGATDTAMRALGMTTTATAVVMRLEQEDAHVEAGTTVLRWSNAGHPPPLVVLPDRSVSVLGGATSTDGSPWGGNDLLLGVEPTVPRTERTRLVPRGSTVLLYTDGLVERRGESLAVGLDRLAGTVRTVAVAQEAGEVDGGLDTLCDAVLDRMVAGRAEDDVALVAVHLYPQDRPRPPQAGPRRTPEWVPDEPAVLTGAPAPPDGV